MLIIAIVILNERNKIIALLSLLKGAIFFGGLGGSSKKLADAYN